MKHFRLPCSLVSREELILEICKGNKVLHLGCADFPYTEQALVSGAWLHDKVTSVSASCVGVDLDYNSVAWLRKHHGITNIKVGDVEQLDQLRIGQFDVVLAGEIIEHLNNPGLFLHAASKVLKSGGKLIITTTNTYCFRRFVRIPFGSESIHPDHSYYFSHTTLHTLVKRFEYRLVKAYSYRLENVRPILPYLIERLATMISPNWGEGIIHVYSLKPEIENI